MGKTFCVAAAALLLMTMRLSAHHAFAAEYDAKKLVSDSGPVTEFILSQSACLVLFGRKRRQRQSDELEL